MNNKLPWPFVVIGLSLLFIILWHEPFTTKLLAGIFIMMLYERLDV